MKLPRVIAELFKVTAASDVHDTSLRSVDENRAHALCKVTDSTADEHALQLAELDVSNGLLLEMDDNDQIPLYHALFHLWIARTPKVENFVRALFKKIEDTHTPEQIQEMIDRLTEGCTLRPQMHETSLITPFAIIAKTNGFNLNAALDRFDLASLPKQDPLPWQRSHGTDRPGTSLLENVYGD